MSIHFPTPLNLVLWDKRLFDSHFQIFTFIFFLVFIIFMRKLTPKIQSWVKKQALMSYLFAVIFIYKWFTHFAVMHHHISLRSHIICINEVCTVIYTPKQFHLFIKCANTISYIVIAFFFQQPPLIFYLCGPHICN